MVQVRKCVIPAAGLGTRLLPATKSQPKEMVPVGRKPVIQYVVEEAVEAGLNEILIVTGSKKRSIEDHFDYDHVLEEELEKKGRNALSRETNILQRDDVQLLFTRQSKPTGLADAVSLAEVFVDGEPFVVSLGDNIVLSPNGGHFLTSLVDMHLEKSAVASMALKRVAPDETSRYGIVDADLDGDRAMIRDLVEKPSTAAAPSDLAIVGRYVFSAEIFDAIHRTPTGIDGEKQLTDAIRILAKEGNPVWGRLITDDHIIHDIGTPYTYAMAFIDLSLRDPEMGPKIREYLKKAVR
jgi:UTP--glucose-1-phosphate uridylyltransferase